MTSMNYFLDMFSHIDVDVRGMHHIYKCRPNRTYYTDFKSTNLCVTVEHVLPPKNAMSTMGFDPGTSGIVNHRSTN